MKRSDNEMEEGIQKKKQEGSACLGIAFFVIALFVFSAILLPFSMRTHRPSKYGQFAACQSNLKNIGTSLEMYSTDNQGHYPMTLNAVTPNYLKIIPTCPSAGSSTGYVNSYSVVSSPDAYTFCCFGNYHSSSNVPSNYPMYTSNAGIILK